MNNLPRQLTREGFIELFYQIYREIGRHEKAYWKSEEEHIKEFGKRNFSSYHAFHKYLSRKIRK